MTNVTSSRLASLLALSLCGAVGCAPGTPAAGSGGSGAMADGCDQYDPEGLNCGVCVRSVEEYCSSTHSCSIPEELECRRFASDATLIFYRGCGYLLRIEDYGEATGGYYAKTYWDEATGELLYLYDNGLSFGDCSPSDVVGQEPSCAADTDICQPGFE